MTSPRALAARAALRRFDLSVLRDYGIVISFIVMFGVLSFASPAFLSTTNLLNILDQSAPVGIIACGATLVIIAGGFDLAAGAIFAITGVIAALVAVHVDPALGLVSGAAVGIAFGLGNGFLVNVLRINAFIATLASSFMIRGLAALITGGFLIAVSDPSYQTLGRGELFGAKYSIFAFTAFVALTWFLLTRTTFGRYCFAVGGNPEAARLSGVRVGVIRSATFALSGLSAGIAGVIASSRISTGQADAGVGIEFSAIAAVVIGGTSIYGGQGAIWRTVLGVLLLALIGNGFNILNVDPFYQRIFEGGIIVLAVSIDALSRRD
jgi:ribose transport system permease protein